MTRAIVGNSKLLLIDEATANVDRADRLIQLVVGDQFKDVAVADTVADWDNFMVLDAGSVVEFDTLVALVARSEIY